VSAWGARIITGSNQGSICDTLWNIMWKSAGCLPFYNQELPLASCWSRILRSLRL
jgi:hypothetical protein